MWSHVKIFKNFEKDPKYPYFFEIFLFFISTRADWPYNEVGKIPRGPSRLGAPKAIGGPLSII
jgi:hypothetical protein